MGDQNRKTLRSFYCRDYLWELFEVMTNDLGCSMDYLVNEAMRHYARSRNYSLAAAARPVEQPVAPNFARQDSEVTPPPQQRRPPPPLPEAQAQHGHAAPQAQAQAPQAGGDRRPLYLTFNGQRYRIEKDKFVIGRGSQMTDLTIRDGNISRKHCAVVFRNGHYFIKDLDSTNGIEFNGKRTEQKRIDDGDVFYLCDYELRFAYR